MNLRTLLNFRHFEQPNDYSCGASVFRMCLRALRGVEIPHSEAEKLTRCKPDGVAYNKLVKVMKNHGLKAGRNVNPSAKWILKHLGEGRLVVVSDFKTYVSDHWALAVTAVGDFIVVADPARGVKLCRSSEVAKRAKEAFTVA